MSRRTEMDVKKNNSNKKKVRWREFCDLYPRDNSKIERLFTL